MDISALGVKAKTARLLNIGLVAAIITFMAIGVSAYRSISDYLAGSVRVNRSRTFHDAMDDVLLCLKDIQRGARGYVITGETNFLEPFQHGREQMVFELDTVETLIGPSREESQKLALVRTLADRMVAATLREVEFVSNKEPDSARQVVLGGEAKRTMDEIDALARQMKADEAKLMADWQAETDADLKESLVLLSLGAGLTFTFIVGIVLGMKRQLRKTEALAESLWRSDQRLQTVMNSIQEGITFSNSEGRFEIFNQRMKELTGYTMEEANRSGDFSRLLYPDPDDHQRALDGVRNIIEHPGLHRIESTITTKSGERRILRVSSQVLGRPEQKMFLTTYVNITERKRAEEELRESTEKLRLIFENAFDGISIFEETPDPDHRRLVECNLRYAELAGRTREELLSAGTTRDFTTSLSKDFSHSIATGSAFRGTFTWLRPDKKENVIEFTAVPITMQGKTFTIGIDRDVSEQKMAEAEREKLITELQTALADVKTLSGLVPICAECKKIRDDKGYWTQLEAYIQARTPAKFTHGICPQCSKKYFPDVHERQA